MFYLLPSLQRMHPWWLLQLHASEAHLSWAEERAVRPSQEGVRASHRCSFQGFGGTPARVVSLTEISSSPPPPASTAAAGLDLDRETVDLAPGIEAEEAAATTIDAAPETESVQDDSELKAMTTYALPPPEPLPIFFKYVPNQISSRNNWKVWQCFFFFSLLLDFLKWTSLNLNLYLTRLIPSLCFHH